MDAAVVDGPPPLPCAELIPQRHGGAMYPPFTGEVSRQAQARAVQARRRNRAKTSQPANQEPRQPTPQSADPWRQGKVAQARARIDSVDFALASALAPREACAHCSQVAGVDALAVQRLQQARESAVRTLLWLTGEGTPVAARPDSRPQRRSKLGE